MADRSQMSQAQLQDWMIAEAARLMDARAKLETPDRQVWTNQIANPNEKPRDRNADEKARAAQLLIAQLKERDEGQTRAERREW